MRPSEADDVAKKIGRAFRLDEDRVDALADELAREKACSECVGRALDRMVRDMTRLPQNPIPVVLSAIRSEMDSGHASHLAAGVEDSAVGVAETWWRTTGVGVIRPRVGGNEILAGFVAARMWQTQAVGMNEAEVSDELDRSAHVWITASAASLRDHGGDDPAHYLERAWTFAREVAKLPPQHWSAGRFEALAV